MEQPLSQEPGRTTGPCAGAPAAGRGQCRTPPSLNPLSLEPPSSAPPCPVRPHSLLGTVYSGCDRLGPGGGADQRESRAGAHGRKCPSAAGRAPARRARPSPGAAAPGHQRRAEGTRVTCVLRGGHVCLMCVCLAGGGHVSHMCVLRGGTRVSHMCVCPAERGHTCFCVSCGEGRHVCMFCRGDMRVCVCPAEGTHMFLYVLWEGGHVCVSVSCRGDMRVCVYSAGRGHTCFCMSCRAGTHACQCVLQRGHACMYVFCGEGTYVFLCILWGGNTRVSVCCAEGTCTRVCPMMRGHACFHVSFSPHVPPKQPPVPAGPQGEVGGTPRAGGDAGARPGDPQGSSGGTWGDPGAPQRHCSAGPRHACAARGGAEGFGVSRPRWGGPCAGAGAAAPGAPSRAVSVLTAPPATTASRRPAA